MFDLAWHDGAGPGPWILFFPLIWAAVFAGAVVLLRRTVWRGRRGAWSGGGHPHDPATGGPGTGPGNSYHSPVDLLGRRLAQGDIDEDEYWRRLSVLQEAGRPYKDGPA